LPLKYYLQPAFNEEIPGSGKHYFFWYRGSLGFPDIKKLIDPHEVDSFIYRSAPDPYFKEEVIPQEDLQNYKLQIISDIKVDSQEKYLTLLKKSNIYIAPRKIEGIGISFLEAMSLGMVVIAYNNGTMNEYIKHNYNGYLFNSETRQINLDNLEEVRNNSKKYGSGGLGKMGERQENNLRFYLCR